MKSHALVYALFFSPFVANANGPAVEFRSPRGINEQCLSIPRSAGTAFSKKDDKEEAELCSHDIYREEVAVCPKTWSTSAGTMLYSTEGTGKTQAQYEAASNCGKKAGHKKLAKFKTTMNQSGTSGTFAPSSFLYYHFSRYFQTLVRVPVSVFRSFDKDEHYSRVASKAGGMSAMNKKAWEILRAAEKNPAAYKPTREVITPDGKQIYGALIGKAGGERYGAEINGVRSKWGDAQNNDFQETPAFLALRSEKALGAAIQDGIGGKKNAKLSADLGSLPLGGVQMGLWMRELTEITLLDFIFNQQDRIGNIDYEWYWVYENGGKVEADKEKRDEYKDLARNRMKNIPAPEKIAGFNPVLVQKSVISDNDAGGRLQYVNYTKKTKMLEKIRHYDAGVYQRLMALHADFAAKGPLYQNLKASYYLDDAQVNQIVKNTAEAAKILGDTCAAGKLRFDLDFDGLVKGSATEARVNCR